MRLVTSSGESVAHVARDLGINEGTLGNWVLRWKQDHASDVEVEPLTPTERAELARLRKENATLRMERESRIKIRALLREADEQVTRYVFIDAQQAVYPVALICRLLKVSRSACYAWAKAGREGSRDLLGGLSDRQDTRARGSVRSSSACNWYTRVNKEGGVDGDTRVRTYNEGDRIQGVRDPSLTRAVSGALRRGGN